MRFGLRPEACTTGCSMGAPGWRPSTTESSRSADGPGRTVPAPDRHRPKVQTLTTVATPAAPKCPDRHRRPMHTMMQSRTSMAAGAGCSCISGGGSAGYDLKSAHHGHPGRPAGRPSCPCQNLGSSHHAGTSQKASGAQQVLPPPNGPNPHPSQRGPGVVDRTVDATLRVLQSSQLS